MSTRFLHVANGSCTTRLIAAAGIPGVLVHGRRDISGPAVTPWRLAEAWPGSELRIVEHEGHGGADEMEQACAAIDAFVRAGD